MNPYIVISLTSIPARAGTLGPTLRSLTAQTCQPNEIRLYLPEGCPAPDDEVVTVYRTDDYGPITKISAVLDRSLPANALVVTVDDDQVYQPRWLETLLEGVRERPDAAVGMAGWNATGFLQDRTNGTYHWGKAPCTVDVIEGWAGVAYRPSFFEGIDILHPPELFRWVDDVWISTCLRERGIDRYMMRTPMSQDEARRPGLHHRHDFVELNRRAAVYGFQMKPKLSIAICSLHGPTYSRTETLIELLDVLHAQPRIEEVEILVAGDAGHEINGDKRNRLKALARGTYIAFIDDDDLVAPNYIEKILAAIDRAPGVDAILIRGCRVDTKGARVEYDYRIGGQEGEWINGVLWRSPSHLCPVRRDLAMRVDFPTLPAGGEDLHWGDKLRPLLRTAERASDEVLYYYRWDPSKRTPRTPRAPLSRPASVEEVVTRPIEPANEHGTIFTPQYTERSGPGSTPDFTVPYRNFLEAFIGNPVHKVSSVLDLGCGDLEIMSRVDLHGASYLGVDCIAERIQRNTKAHGPRLRFECHDVHAWDFPATDLILCKDVIQHWSNADVIGWLRRLLNLRSRFRYALITNCNYGPTINTEITTGGWRAIDLLRPPFSAGTIGEVVFRWNQKDVVMIRGEAVLRGDST